MIERGSGGRDRRKGDRRWRLGRAAASALARGAFGRSGARSGGVRQTTGLSQAAVAETLRRAFQRRSTMRGFEARRVLL